MRKQTILFLLFFISSGCVFSRLYTEKPTTIGAIAPSSSYLANALIEEIDCNKTPKTILEVGAGSGSITNVLETCLKPQDHLIVYEIEPELCAMLEETFKHSKKHIIIRCQDIRSLTTQSNDTFDYIVSTLPFNAFEPELVDDILNLYLAVLKDQGSISFFEYLFFPSIKVTFGTSSDIKRSRNVRQVIESYLKNYSFNQRNVWLNITPAVVYYLKQSASQ